MEDEARCERVCHSKALLKGCLLGYRTLSMARKSVPTGLAAGIREGLFSDANAGRTAVKSENAGVKNYLRHKLGDARYHEIINSVVILDKIHYCQRAITALPAYLNPVLLDYSGKNCGKNSDPTVQASQRAFIGHDFLDSSGNSCGKNSNLAVRASQRAFISHDFLDSSGKNCGKNTDPAVRASQRAFIGHDFLDSSGNNCGKKSDPAARASQRAFISHDFLVLEVRFGSEALYIKAEKVYPPTRVASIVIDLYDDFQVKASSIVLFTVDCRNKKMAMDELVFILASHTLKYDYASENCWDYAVKTAKRLLQACQALPGVSAEEAERLRKEEKYLEGRIAEYHCHNVLHAFKRMVHV